MADLVHGGAADTSSQAGLHPAASAGDPPKHPTQLSDNEAVESKWSSVIAAINDSKNSIKMIGVGSGGRTSERCVSLFADFLYL